MSQPRKSTRRQAAATQRKAPLAQPAAQASETRLRVAKKPALESAVRLKAAEATYTPRERFVGHAIYGVTSLSVAAHPSERYPTSIAERLRFLEDAAVNLATATELLPEARREATGAVERGEEGAVEQLAELEDMARSVATVMPWVAEWRELLTREAAK